MYFFPPDSFLTGSSPRWTAPAPLPFTWVVTSQISLTRCPGAFRESHSTQNPDILGNRLNEFQIFDDQAHVQAVEYMTHPSWAGQVLRELSIASHIVWPSTSRTITGSWKGSISRTSPRVMIPDMGFNLQLIWKTRARHLTGSIYGIASESAGAEKDAIRSIAPLHAQSIVVHVSRDITEPVR